MANPAFRQQSPEYIIVNSTVGVIDVTAGIAFGFAARALRLVNDGGGLGGPIYYSLASSALTAATGDRLSTGESILLNPIPSPATAIGLYATATSSGSKLRLAAWG